MRLIFLFISIFLIKNNFSQEKNTCHQAENKDAIKQYEKGIDKKKYKKEERMKFLEKAMELDPEYVEAIFVFVQERIKTIVYEQTTFKPIEQHLLKIIEICPQYHSDPYYYLGFSYYEQQKYEESIQYLQKFVKFSDEDDKKFSKDYDGMSNQAKEMIKYAKMYAEIENMKKNPVPFDPHPVEGLCTIKDEYLPIVSPDNVMALYTRRQAFTSKNTVFQTDKEIEVFSFSKRNSQGTFDGGSPMPSPPFNKNANEGGASISIDNKHLYYTICKDEGGTQLNCDIYYSDFINGEWTEVKKVLNINDPMYWDSQPSIASDGKTLYFASDRKGGLGGVDIYKTVRDATGIWSTPVNIGNKINTSGNEKSPFMHSDSETLYFSSDGHPGLGGFDIFLVKKDDKGEWIQPKNLGYPINTEADDLGFFASTDGHLGYFASNNSSKVKGKVVGGYDIYSFDLYKEARPEAVAFLKGTLKDEKGDPLKGATLEIKDAKTKEKTDAVIDTTTGEYTAIVNIKKKNDLIITVKKEGYAFNSELIPAKEMTSEVKPIEINIENKPIETGKAYTLNNIYYSTNSSSLRDESKIVIEEFVLFLKENTSVKVEIHGHTDNVGNDTDNQALSTDRAFSVYDLALQKGVGKSQLVAFKGFGKSKPIASNNTEQGRAKNRRIEFVIVSK